jgi:predicted peptidase
MSLETSISSYDAGPLILAAVMTGHFLARSVTIDGVSRGYQVWIPAAYDASRKWPAILFLHGAGERGDDNEKQLAAGLGPALRSSKVDVRAIIVFPQCPAGQRWSGAPRKIAIAALDDAKREFNIDRRRVALTGLSMGGAGAWMLAAEYPKRWSALAPSCAYLHGQPT